MTSNVITFSLLVSLLTLSQVRSDCNYYQILKPGITYYVYNPEYPDMYKNGSHCQWVTESPYDIKVDCNLNISKTPNCSGDKFSIQFSGEKTHVYCGTGTSAHKGRNPIIKFDSSCYSNGGTFSCKIQAEKPFDEHNCTCGWKNPTRIVGGENTGVNEYPMMAGLVDITERKINCGATIISQMHVLTAAHCVDKKSLNKIGVVVGEHDVTTGKDTSATKLYPIHNCIIHPQYQDIYNDIAVCQIIGTIQYSVKVGPVCLPFQHRYDSFIGSSVTLLGWGMTEYGGATSDVLKKTSVSVINTEKCGSYYPKKQITRSHMCTYTPGKDACQMDSGGPALWENPNTHKMILVGITSAGIGCGWDVPAIYTRVGDHIDWIMFVTPDVLFCQKE